MPKSLKFKEKKKIQVFPAADPSDILWENLDAPRKLSVHCFSANCVTLPLPDAKVELRRCGTLFASALVVILSFLIVLVRHCHRA